MLLAWLGKIAAHPFVARILLPAITSALTDFLNRQAGKLEVKTAVKAAKAAKTAEELRNASKKLSDASRRR